MKFVLYQYDGTTGKLVPIIKSNNSNFLKDYAIRHGGEFQIKENREVEIWNNFKDRKDKP